MKYHVYSLKIYAFQYSGFPQNTHNTFLIALPNYFSIKFNLMEIEGYIL